MTKKKASKKPVTKTTATMMKGLKRLIEKSSLSQVARDLGYNSHNTVASWLKKSSIPGHAQAQVAKLIGA